MLAALEPDLAEPALLHRRPGSFIPSNSAPANRAAKRIHATHYNVLFLCADNSVNSTLAEALLRRWGGERFRAFSAAVSRRAGIHPLAAEFLRAQRLWHPALYSKSCRKFLAPSAPMDFVISVGEQVPEGLPQAWPGHPEVIHWHISDPKLNGSPKEQANSLRKTFVELENRVRLFVLVYEREAKKIARAAA